MAIDKREPLRDLLGAPGLHPPAVHPCSGGGPYLSRGYTSRTTSNRSSTRVMAAVHVARVGASNDLLP